MSLLWSISFGGKIIIENYLIYTCSHTVFLNVSQLMNVIDPKGGFKWSGENLRNCINILRIYLNVKSQYHLIWHNEQYKRKCLCTRMCIVYRILITCQIIQIYICILSFQFWMLHHPVRCNCGVLSFVLCERLNDFKWMWSGVLMFVLFVIN